MYNTVFVYYIFNPNPKSMKKLFFFLIMLSAISVLSSGCAASRKSGCPAIENIIH